MSEEEYLSKCPLLIEKMKELVLHATAGMLHGDMSHASIHAAQQRADAGMKRLLGPLAEQVHLYVILGQEEEKGNVLCLLAETSTGEPLTPSPELLESMEQHLRQTILN